MRTEKDAHAAVRDLDAIRLQVQQLARHLVLARKRDFPHDACIETWYAQSTSQEYAHVARRDQRRQKLKRLLGVQSGTVSRDQFEGRPQKVICGLDQRTQVDPKEGKEYVTGFGVWLMYSLAISVEGGVRGRSIEDRRSAYCSALS